MTKTTGMGLEALFAEWFKQHPNGCVCKQCTDPEKVLPYVEYFDPMWEAKLKRAKPDEVDPAD